MKKMGQSQFGSASAVPPPEPTDKKFSTRLNLLLRGESLKFFPTKKPARPITSLTSNLSIGSQKAPPLKNMIGKVQTLLAKPKGTSKRSQCFEISHLKTKQTVHSTPMDVSVVREASTHREPCEPRTVKSPASAAVRSRRLALNATQAPMSTKHLQKPATALKKSFAFTPHCTTKLHKFSTSDFSKFAKQPDAPSPEPKTPVVRLDWLAARQGKFRKLERAHGKLGDNHFKLIAAIEKFAFDFVDTVQNPDAIYELFKDYIDFIQDNDFEALLRLLPVEYGELFKRCFYVERLAFLTCFYLSLLESFQAEIIYIQKLTALLLSNTLSFVDVVEQLFPGTRDRLPRRDGRHRFSHELVADANDKIWRLVRLLLEFEVQLCNRLEKIHLIIETSSLSELVGELIEVFKSRYRAKGVVQEGEPEPPLSAKEPPRSAQSLPPPATAEPGSREYTLVLNLDETLMHCASPQADAPVNFRPHLQTFLEAVSPNYRIILFTASLQAYADPVIDAIDKDRRFFAKRYYREDTTGGADGGFLRDFERLGLDPCRTIIIDNAPETIEAQRDNGIYVKPFIDDPKDAVLLNLLPVLEAIVDTRADDVRSFLQVYRNTLIEIIRKGSLFPAAEFAFK